MFSNSRMFVHRVRIKQSMKLLRDFQYAPNNQGYINHDSFINSRSISILSNNLYLNQKEDHRPQLFSLAKQNTSSSQESRQESSQTGAGNSLSLQSQLGKLPVPSLKDTLPKFLRTIRPLLNNEEYDETFGKVKDFAKEGGVGHTLQALLEERAKTTENWFSDWWLEMAYLGYRDPVIVWSSPGIVWPTQKFEDKKDMIKFAAKAIAGALDYKIAVDNQTIPVEMQGGKPLDMQQYFKVFGTTRMPAMPSDKQSFNPQSKHILVIYNNHFFKVEVYGETGEQLSAEQIQASLEDIVKMVSDTGPEIGILTSNNRDEWSKDYEILASNKKNKVSLKEIETALFTMNLDPNYGDYLAHDDLSKSALISLHGGGSNHGGANRWHDKTIQMFVAESGECGMTYEHSPAEGPPLMILTDHILGYIAGTVRNGTNLPAIKYSPVQKLDFILNDALNLSISKAGENLDKLVNEVDMHVLHFTHFGKSEIKSFGFSPDSFIQIAIQLAFYRLQKEPGAHYESGGTRQFIHGRTEVIRSCSIESVEFAKAVSNSEGTINDKFVLMKRAIQSHNSYARLAVAGLGVDRHLQGMKKIGLENGIEPHDLFSDIGYTKSSRMRISTSQVAGSTASFLCFGPLVSDGYGCCYNPRSNDIFLPCSALNSCAETNATAFRDAVEQSLLDMRLIALENIQQAKL
eukprot:GFUD01017361.1.p1 GENE.GFUD01017361.1~~GFUD01017361.1.p1  ORF type:complete len:687 (-),score=159.37 GFUD01017361.1:44-2104(-)